MWQDPLRRRRNTKPRFKARKMFQQRILCTPSGRSGKATLAGLVQLLGISSDDSGRLVREYSESRLRMRQAVLEALGAQSYVPRDGEHIGYFKIDKPEWDWRSMIVPFEWCERNVHKAERIPPHSSFPIAYVCSGCAMKNFKISRCLGWIGCSATSTRSALIQRM